MAAIARADTDRPAGLGVSPPTLGHAAPTRRSYPGKRLLDIVLAAALLVLTAPLFAVAAVAIRLGDGGPVFYRQPRVGRGGSVFRIVKFRTMVVGADACLDPLRSQDVTDGLLFKVPNDPRVTRVGRWLRASSLDELPQLWNVLRGEMSIVGPRPIAAKPGDFTAAEHERHATRPGITGYWQLAGRPWRSFHDMVQLDLAYLRGWSLWLDIRLILRTVPTMIFGLARASEELR